MAVQEKDDAVVIVEKDQVLETPVKEEVLTAESVPVEPDPVAPPVKEDEFTVSIGEEEPESEPHGPAPTWVKEMRRQNKELRKQLAQLQKVQPVAPVLELGEKPTLESLDYDTQKYEEALTKWYAKKLKIDEQNAKATAQWQEKLSSYNRAKVELGAEDYEDAEAVVLQHFDVAQQSIIVSGAKDAALLVYALGKNPVKAAALGAIKDPVQFIFAVARLEAQLKVSGKKPATPPETRVTGNGRVSGGIDATLERLRAEAERTGDYTRVTRYKRDKLKRS